MGEGHAAQLGHALHRADTGGDFGGAHIAWHAGGAGEVVHAGIDAVLRVLKAAHGRRIEVAVMLGQPLHVGL